MKIGIDSYCYNRLFGAGQGDTRPRRSLDDLIAKAKELRVAGLSLETVFMPSLDVGYLRELKAKLDEAHMQRVLAWGHPNGLQMGASPEAAVDLRAHYRSAQILGASVMRMVCGSFAFRDREPIDRSYARLVPMLKDLAAEAGANGLTLGMENHGDFTADEAIQLLERVDSPHLKITMDTGNNIRLLEDPVKASVKLAPHAVATHIKDIVATGIGSPLEWRTFWPSTGLGHGIINLPVILQALKDAGYQGLLCVEIDTLPEGQEEDSELAASIAYLRQVLPTLQ